MYIVKEDGTPDFSASDTVQTFLEEMVDGVGVTNVLSELIEVCHLKASHILENWQDAQSAKLWENCAQTLEKFQNNRIFPS